MQEGAFPRVAHSSSLNLMLGQDFVHYCPSSTDLDRYLFLEALHSAQDYFLVSYQGYNYKETKEYQPSLVIE
jgi:exodeoxyribonuclease V gamma subunit